MLDRSWALAWAAPVALMCATSAGAQTTPTAGSAIANTSPVTGSDVSVSVDVANDTNVARSDAQLAALRGLSRDDTIITPDLNFEYLRPIGAQSVYLRGDLGYDFYARDHVLNRENIDIGGGGNAKFSLCSATANADYRRRQSDLQELSTVSIVQNVGSTETVGLNAICGPQVGLSPTFSVSQAWDSNSNVLLKTSNYRSLTMSGGLAYRQPVFGQLTLFGQYVRTQFPNRLILTNVGSLGSDGYKLYAGGVRFERQIGARIEGTLSVSYSKLDPDVSNAPRFAGVTYDAEIHVRLTGRIHVTLDLSRSAQPSNRLDATFSRESDESVDITFTARPNWDFDIGATDSNRHYEGPALVVGVDLTTERVTTGYASTTYHFGRGFFTTLDTRVESRVSDRLPLNYTSVRTGLTLGARF